MQIDSKLNTGYYMPKAGSSPKKETNMENTEEVKDYAKVLGEKKEELWNKIISGDTEPAYQIGGQAFSEKEWERLLRRIDEEIETDKEEGTEENSSVEPYAALTAEITDKKTFLGQQLSKAEQRAEELKRIRKGIYEMQAMIDGQSMETLIEDQEKAEEKRTGETKQEKSKGTEEVQEEKKSGREEIMEMMMSGARQVL